MIYSLILNIISFIFNIFLYLINNFWLKESKLYYLNNSLIKSIYIIFLINFLTLIIIFINFKYLNFNLLIYLFLILNFLSFYEFYLGFSLFFEPFTYLSEFGYYWIKNFNNSIINQINLKFNCCDFHKIGEFTNCNKNSISCLNTLNNYFSKFISYSGILFIEQFLNHFLTSIYLLNYYLKPF